VLTLKKAKSIPTLDVALWLRAKVRGFGAAFGRIYEQHVGKIDVILTDLVMPGIDGVGVANAVQAARELAVQTKFAASSEVQIPYSRHWTLPGSMLI